LYSSSSIIRVIKPRRLRWEGHVINTRGRDEKYIESFGRKPDGKRPHNNAYMGGILLQQILER